LNALWLQKTCMRVLLKQRWLAIAEEWRRKIFA
jgi:hypothetical protein